MVFLLGLLALSGPTSAQESVADFYRGKQIKIIVGSAAGSGYDVYARLLARHMGEHIPGNPSMLVQKMPGAGGLAATNQLYARAPRDGLTIGAVQGSLTFAQVGKSPNALFDMRKFGWLGSANKTSNTCVFSPRAGIASARDLLEKKVIVGASGGSTDFVPNLLNALVGTKFEIVKGYKSTSAVLPAIEGGEVDGYVRPFIAPPEVPADRLEALQKAFAAALNDPDLLGEAEKAGIEIRYVSPNQVNAALSQAFEAPESIKERGLEELRKSGWQGL